MCFLNSRKRVYFLCGRGLKIRRMKFRGLKSTNGRPMGLTASAMPNTRSSFSMYLIEHNPLIARSLAAIYKLDTKSPSLHWFSQFARIPDFFATQLSELPPQRRRLCCSHPGLFARNTEFTNNKNRCTIGAFGGRPQLHHRRKSECAL
jgi:hypothetical protein